MGSFRRTVWDFIFIQGELRIEERTLKKCSPFLSTGSRFNCKTTPLWQKLPLQSVCCGAANTSSCGIWNKKQVSREVRCKNLKPLSTLCDACFWKTIWPPFFWVFQSRNRTKFNFFKHFIYCSVVAPLVCAEIYKTLTPANPVATKTGK